MKITVITGPVSEATGPAAVGSASPVLGQAHVTTFGTDPRRGTAAHSDAEMARVDELISGSDIVTLSDDDLSCLRPGDRHGDATRWLMSRGPAILVVTHSDASVTGYTRSGSVHVRGHHGEVADSAEWESAFVTALQQALTARGLLDGSADRSLRAIDLDDLRGILHDANVSAVQSVTPATVRTPRTTEVTASALFRKMSEHRGVWSGGSDPMIPGAMAWC